MKFINFKNETEASQFVADELIAAIKKNPHIVLGLATGSTPIPLYKDLADDYKKNHTDWSKVTTFNLDEYLGLPEGHPQTYKVFMTEQLFSKVNIDLKNTHFPAKGQDYDDLIEDNGGIDVQILGIGTNGHIGFNEPGSTLDSLTRVVDLTQETINVNAKKFFDGDTSQVPKTALSMGIKSILKAKKIILLAFGHTKQEAIAQLKKSETSGFNINCPASALSLHSDVIIVTDEGANVDL